MAGVHAYSGKKMTRAGAYRVSIATVFLLDFLLSGMPAGAAVLMVGPTQTYKKPSDAALVAKAGDTVRIDKGTYFDCAVWSVDNLIIDGASQGTVLTDKICQGKAIFVVHANGVTVRNITFQRARADDGNGAGIRAEGAGLTVERSKFFNNQSGILSGDVGGSAIIVRDSEFDHNGTCVRSCAHGVYVGHIASLEIDNSRFFNTLAGHHIKSRALRTVLNGNHIEDGPEGTASYEIDIPNGGSLVMTGNVIEKGPKNLNHKAAVMIGEEGQLQYTVELVIRNNTFTNDGPSPFYFLYRTAFVRNETPVPVQLTGNILKGWNVTAFVGPGTAQ
jgi:hypothetical protein